ncbi:class I SAM-dependent methyltransferase [Candidatus Bathyarchaeota archaeon]|nr:class I SAM-dependent methyltransferase [Candidatus Bathyarchaeota archaeon]
MSSAPLDVGFLSSLSYRCYDLGVLPLYDVMVLDINCAYAWSAPVSTTLLPFWRAHFSDNHLDIGVGSGFFPSTVLGDAESADQKLTIWDLSTTALAKTKRRVEMAAPHVVVQTIEADATALPASVDTSRKFDSISASLLLHCIPMSPEEKMRGLVATARQLLSPTGVFYGTTVLGDTARKITVPSATIDWLPGGETSFGISGEAKVATGLNLFGWAVMSFYNRAGIFTNWEDKPDVFVEALEEGFEIVDSWVIGQVLVFRARGPRAEVEGSSE